MTSEQVLDHPALVLDQRARKRYFDDGFLTVSGYVAPAWLDRLRAVVAAKIEASRALTASDDQFDLAPDHSAEKPNIRRLRKAVDQHPELWAFAQDSAVVDLVADLLGPDVRFHSSKLNFKRSGGATLCAGTRTSGLAAHELRRADLLRLERTRRGSPRWIRWLPLDLSAQAPTSRPALVEQAPGRPSP